VMLASLAAMAVFGKRPLDAKTGKGEEARLGEIGDLE
jgi:hypothetical protein